MAFTESSEPKTEVVVTFKANCSLGHYPKEYAEFLQKLFNFYYPQHHVTEIVVTRVSEVVETPAQVKKPAPAVVAEDEDYS
jgi:hypothetical protein